jgi:hypothetical protein
MTTLKSPRRQVKMAGSKGPTVGRKRKPQTKEVAKTLKGRFGSRLSALATTTLPTIRRKRLKLA